jgi:lysophospholipase L1-like esterase
MGATTFWSDTATDTAGTLVTAHTPGTGGAYSVHPAYSGNMQITAGNRIRNSQTATCVIISAAVPGASDYDVQGDAFFAGGGVSLAGIAGRYDPTADTGYRFYYNGAGTNVWELHKRVAGSDTLLGSSSLLNTLSISSTYTPLMQFRTTASGKLVIACFVNGTLVLTATDSSPIAGPGRVGMVMNSAAAPTDSIGLQLDNLSGLVPAIVFSPVTVHTGGSLPVAAVGNATGWSGGSTFSISGGTGSAVNSKAFTDATHYSINISPGSTAGVLTITDNNGNSGTVLVGAPVIAATPNTAGINQTETITFNGTYTDWATETTPPVFALSGGTGASKISQVIVSDGVATITIVTGTASGTLTITDPSTGGTATVAVVSIGFVPPNDANLFWTANWYKSGANYVQSNCLGAYLKTSFTGTSCKVNVDVGPNVQGQMASVSYPTLRVSVDGGAYVDTLLTASTSQVVVATGLASGTHTLELHFLRTDSTYDRWVNLYNIVRITGLVLDSGAVTVAPTLRPKRLRVYGDSIVAGHFVLGTGNPGGHDATASFCHGLALALNAEVAMFGFGSQGYITAGSGSVPAFNASSGTITTWDKWDSLHSLLVAGQLSPLPDFIVIEHGTNDRAGLDATVLAAAQNFMTAIRAAAPGVPIGIMIPFGQFEVTPITTAWTNYQVATPDPLMYLINCGTGADAGITAVGSTATQQSFDGIHPNVATDGRLASTLALQFQQAIGGQISPNASVVLTPSLSMLNTPYLLGLGDTQPSLYGTIYAANGLAQDLTGCTLQFEYKIPGSGGTTTRSATVLSPATAGQFRFDPISADTAVSASYVARLIVTDSQGRKHSVPNGTGSTGYFPFIVSAMP